jgi:hypothetical protein
VIGARQSDRASVGNDEALAVARSDEQTAFYMSTAFGF